MPGDCSVKTRAPLGPSTARGMGELYNARVKIFRRSSVGRVASRGDCACGFDGGLALFPRLRRGNCMMLLNAPVLGFDKGSGVW